jgi:hypothetical protein
MTKNAANTVTAHFVRRRCSKRLRALRRQASSTTSTVKCISGSSFSVPSTSQSVVTSWKCGKGWAMVGGAERQPERRLPNDWIFARVARQASLI